MIMYCSKSEASITDPLFSHCQNVYVDLDGTIKPHKFPKPGMWKFDGQVWYLLNLKFN